jgi:hypothetical protein
MEDFMVCGGVVTMFMLVFGFIVVMRYLSYRETLALAEKGLVKPERRNGKGALVWGILITAIGAALIIGLLPFGIWINNNARFGPFGVFGPWLLPGLVPMFFGIGLILVYVLTRESPSKESASPSLPAAPAATEAARVEPPPGSTA